MIEAQGITEIEILINSPGGNTCAGFSIADAINRAEDNGFDIRCSAEGVVASAAISILLACNERSSGPSTVFMVHEAMSMSNKHPKSLLDMMNKIHVDMLVRHTKINDRSRWERYMAETKWFTAQTALEWGIIQRIE
jgi:ATP-dependent protease ClpP protease subunit